VLHSERFVDAALAQVYATLLDSGRYLASERTMCRIVAANNEVRERRNPLRRPNYAKPELLTAKPNELWSWDITKLLGPAKRTYYYLCVIFDVFRRYVVGWMVAHRELAALAQRLIADDNPYSESQFRTMKYRPGFPKRNGCIEDARGHSMEFFDWYNTEHRHSGIGYHTPESVHYGLAAGIPRATAAVLEAAYAADSERFLRAMPQPPTLPTAVWVNPPAKEVTKVRYFPREVPHLRVFVRQNC
jgi:putative transposase